MRLAVRKRFVRETDHERVFRYDMVIVSETQEESRQLDLLGDIVRDPDGLIVSGAFELRLSDGWADHYVLLKGEKEHIEPV